MIFHYFEWAGLNMGSITGRCLFWQWRFSWSYNQLQKCLRHCTVFWPKWPVHDLVLVISPPPLIKVASNTRPCSKLGGTTLNGRKEGAAIISKKCRFFRGSVSTFLQLVVACAPPARTSGWTHGFSIVICSNQILACSNGAVN